MCKILLRGLGIISTPGKPDSENFILFDFLAVPDPRELAGVGNIVAQPGISRPASKLHPVGGFPTRAN